MGRIGRPLVIGPLVVLLVVALGVGWARMEKAIPLGDRGRVTAVNDGNCASISIELGDDVKLKGGGWNEDTGEVEVPRSWRGRSIEGRLVLERRTGEDGVEGTFTADDGTQVRVSGGRDQFFNLACAIWGS